MNDTHKASELDTLVGLVAFVDAMITVLVDYGIEYEDAKKLVHRALDTGFETYIDDVKSEKGMLQ